MDHSIDHGPVKRIGDLNKQQGTGKPSVSLGRVQGKHDRPGRLARFALLASVDQLNKQHGRDRVRWAAWGEDCTRKLRAEFLSPTYATR